MRDEVRKLAKRAIEFSKPYLDSFRSSSYFDLFSSGSETEIFPPYVPYISEDYWESKPKIIVYATAQNIPSCDKIRRNYRKALDKDKKLLTWRLYWDGSQDKIPSTYIFSPISFPCVTIYPYQCGILPAIAALLFFLKSKEMFSLDQVHQHVAATNYYKFSLINKKGRDLNPRRIPNKYGDFIREYYELNDKLVAKELNMLDPDYIIFCFLNKRADGKTEAELHPSHKHKILITADPAWILRGGSGLLKPGGNWDTGLELPKAIRVNYLKQICESESWNRYRGEQKRKRIEIFLKHYYNCWKKNF